MRDVRTSHFHQVSRRDLCYVSENEQIRFRVLCLFLVQEEDLLPVKEEDLLLGQEEDLLLVKEEHLLLAQDEDLLLVQEEDLLLVQGRSSSCTRTKRAITKRT